MTGPSNLDLAQYVLAHSHMQLNTSLPITVQTPHHTSFLGRLIDVLSRPNYAVANAVHYAHDLRNPLTGVVRGLSGTEKTTFSDVLKKDLGVKNNALAGFGGAGLDILTDPTMLIGPGEVKAGLSALKLTKGAKEAEVLGKAATDIDHTYTGVNNVLQSEKQINLSDFFKGASEGTPIKPPVDVPLTPTLGKQRGILKEASSVVPDATPKPLPDLGNLTSYEQTIADSISARRLTSKKVGKFIDPHDQLQIWKELARNAESGVTQSGKSAAAAKKAAKERFDSTLRMYTHVQNVFKDAGQDFRYWDGSKVGLTDVIAELTHGKPTAQALSVAHDFMPFVEKELSRRKGAIEHPEIKQAVDNVRVRSAILDSPKIQQAVQDVLNQGGLLAQYPASQAHIGKLVKALPQLAQKTAENLGVSELGADAAKSIINHMNMTVSQDKIVTKQSLQQGLAHEKQRLRADSLRAKAEVRKAKEIALYYNKINKAHLLNEAETKKIQAVLDLKPGEYRMPLDTKGAVKEAFLGRLLAWYGQRDLRPITEQHLMTATNSAWLRYQSIQKVSENFSREQQLQALRFAIGVDPTSSTLGLAFKANLENLFRGVQLAARDWEDASVASRAPLILTRLNKHLKQVGAPWQFKKGSVKNPITGVTVDFSKNGDWLKSWTQWDIKDPLMFFSKVQAAVEQAVHEKALFDEIGERFGATAIGGGHHVSFDHDYLHGYYFTEEIARQIPKVVRDVDEFFQMGTNSQFLKLFDKVSRAWKYTVTLPNPSHHIHNLIGDSYLNWMAGVNSVTPYRYAAQVLRTQKNRYTNLFDVERVVSMDAIERAMARTPDAKDVLFRNASGHAFSAEQIYIAANQMGTLPQAHVVEDIMGGNQALTKFQPFGGKVRRNLELFSETREHFVRLAHFIDIVKKSKGTDFASIFRKAGNEIRKWHPDFLTLTPFEKRFMRRIMPFYSWTRKAIPLVVESAVMNPGKTTMYPKIMQGFQESMGIKSPGRDDPFPVDQGFPQWIRDRGIGPIFREPQLGARDTPPGYTIVNPSNPLIDLFGQFSSPVSGFGSMLSPAIKIPVELLSQKQLFNQAPITGANLPEYLGNQLPYFPVIQGITGITPTLGQTQRAQKEGNINTERLVNWLTGLGVRGTGPYIDQANFEAHAKAQGR